MLPVPIAIFMIARARLPQVIERRLAAVGSLGTVAGRARIDDARIERAQCPRSRAPAAARRPCGNSARRRRSRGQLMHNLARLGLLQIRARYFSCGGCSPRSSKLRPLRDGRTARDREDRAARVAVLALFDLDHLGAEVGEHRGRDRPLLPNRPVDNPNSVKRSAHAFLYTTTLLSLCAAGRINHICPRSPRWPTFCFRPDARRAERRSRPTAGAYALDASRGSSGCRSRAAKFAAAPLDVGGHRRAAMRPMPRASAAISNRAHGRALSHRRPRTNPAACPR